MNNRKQTSKVSNDAVTLKAAIVQIVIRYISPPELIVSVQSKRHCENAS